MELGQALKIRNGTASFITNQVMKYVYRAIVTRSYINTCTGR